MSPRSNEEKKKGGADDEHLYRLPENSTSLAIVGPDGTGKSVFALHLASYYQAYLRWHLNQSDRLWKNAPLIVYLSSDLRYPTAERVWNNFYLDYPWSRYIPQLPSAHIAFRRQLLGRTPNDPKIFKVTLRKCDPGERLVAKLRAGQIGLSPSKARVNFLDLASNTTGDDWQFAARLLASLPRMGKAPPNLLVIDSVPGFESMVGQRNSFGEKMARRARIAQLLRAAGENWHVVFVVEEPPQGMHLPEEYVTDSVIHLRRYGQGEEAHRTVEIEKLRGRSFAVGEHPFEIRDGAGSSTASWENSDDSPALPHERFYNKVRSIIEGRSGFNAYVQVFPSLQFLSSDFARRTNVDIDPYALKSKRYPGTLLEDPIPFGIPYLDNMLATGASKNKASSVRGLPAGSITAIVGDEGTCKASLAERFLSEAFADFRTVLDQTLNFVQNYRQIPTETFANFLRQHWLRYYPENKRIREAAAGDIKVRVEEIQLIAENFNLTLLEDADLVKRAKGEGPLGRDPRPHPLLRRWDETFYYGELPGSPKTAPSPDHDFILALSILRAGLGILSPAVYVCTHDNSAESIARQVIEKHSKKITEVLVTHGICSAQDAPLRFPALARLLEHYVLVRRIELDSATAPQLWHIINSSVYRALLLYGYSEQVLEAALDTPGKAAGNVRVVLSDLHLIRDAYPSAAADPLFLPTVVFRLRRAGVTTLIVDSDNGRPNQLPSHPMSGALRSLVDRVIYTWKVPFFGEHRIALMVIPPMDPEAAGVIRELKPGVPQQKEGTDEAQSLDVDPHFELYTGLEEGQPKPIPLRVVLYGETPAFEEYIEAEKALFRHIFAADQDASSVVEVRNSHDYDGLRDYCELPVDTCLPYTLVFMVDGYWALGRHYSLRNLEHYLFDPLWRANRRDDYRDVFRLYRKTKGAPVAPRSDEHRADFYSQGKFPGRYQYRSRITKAYPSVDRVPFMWDFGFLLCNERQWIAASEVKLPVQNDKTVGRVWKYLTRMTVLEEAKAQDPGLLENPGGRQALLLGRPRRHQGNPEEVVSWGEFLEAALTVARVEEKRAGRAMLPFDLAMLSPDSLTCLILEIWFSEILDDALRMEEHEKTLRHIALTPEGETLEGDNSLADAARDWRKAAFAHLSGFSEELYQGQASMYSKDPASPEPRPYLYDFLGKDILARFKEIKDTNEPATNNVSKARRFIKLHAPPADGKQSYAIQLYRTWLLLLEVLNFAKYFDPKRPFELKVDLQPSYDAVAARHWYKTACVACQDDLATHGGDRAVQTKTPVRLPGHFSTRGDWFLAVAKGSRSYRLADRALDMLTSRRANRSRLHLGMGLPTRDLLEDKYIGQIRTRMTVATPDAVWDVTYEDLLHLCGNYAIHEEGCAESEPPQPRRTNELPVMKKNSFFWLYRTSFKDYDRCARAVRKWVHRMLMWTLRYRHQRRATWIEYSGFRAYQDIVDGDLSRVRGFGSFLEFASGLDAMAMDLKFCCQEDDPKPD
jgi:KaiC/GvpD/RAD55 family RecA-like ATPase